MKRIIFILMIFVLIITTIGCTQSDLENYNSAMVKTDNMSKGSSFMEIKTKTKYNTEGLDTEALRFLETFENTNITIKSSFDKAIKRGMGEAYLDIAELGYDFYIYNVDDKYYIEPLFINLKDKKYIELDIESIATEGEKSEELFKAFSRKWTEIINEENVMKGKKVLISTDDGEVKSREFTIDLEDEQLKELLIYFIEIFEESEVYKDLAKQAIYNNSNISEELSELQKNELSKELFKELNDFVLNAKNLNLFYKAYIDIDGYVIQEDINFTFVNDNVSPGELKSIEFELNSQYTNIEKEQNLLFEEPTTENSIDMEDVDFENIFEPQEGGKK